MLPFLPRRLPVCWLLLVSLIVGASSAAEPKPWIKLSDCHYVEGAENDGDSFRIRDGEKEFNARLYYVDAAETNLRQAERTHEQSLHFGITLDETMKAGAKAKERVRELLQKPFVVWTRWATAGGRGREPRYYVIVEADEKRLAEILVSEGLARTKGVAGKTPDGVKARDYMQRLEDLEQQARGKRTGAWATTNKTETEPKPDDQKN